jgi:SAM-dependent methyltransferase
VAQANSVSEPLRLGSAAAQAQAGERPANYYSSSRADLVSVVPLCARRVLDVGCGTGQLGRVLRQRGHHVSGIELMPAAAEEAADHLDEVVCGDIETIELPWPDASFDAILCGDVLEHLADPWRTLRRLSALLISGGLVIASIPNVQNYRVIRGLLRGRWDYRERGLLDFGHLRFFTWRTIVQLFGQADLEIVQAQAGWNRTALRQLFCCLSGGVAERFLARYYLVVGQRR